MVYFDKILFLCLLRNVKLKTQGNNMTKRDGTFKLGWKWNPYRRNVVLQVSTSETPSQPTTTPPKETDGRPGFTTRPEIVPTTEGQA